MRRAWYNRGAKLRMVQRLALGVLWPFPRTRSGGANTGTPAFAAGEGAPREGETGRGIMWTRLIAAMAVMVCHCAPAGAQSVPMPPVRSEAAVRSVPAAKRLVRLTADQRRIVEAGVRGALKDPASARFGIMVANSKTTKDGRTVTVCGYVNARNSFGGYTGRGPFLGLLFSPPGLFVPIDVASPNTIDANVVRQMCAKEGIELERFAVGARAQSQLPVAASPKVPPKLVRLTANQRRIVEAGVRGMLKGAAAARFGKMVAAIENDRMIKVCGYVDDGPFIGFLEDDYRFVPISIELASTLNAQATYNACAGFGLVLGSP